MDIQSLRTSPRLIAPLLVAVFGLALLLLVVTSSGGGSTTPASRSSVEKQRDLGIGTYAQQQAHGSSTPSPQPPTYVVKPGDTLGAISQKTGMSVAQLQQLNPSIDPQALVAGQRLKLR